MDMLMLYIVAFHGPIQLESTSHWLYGNHMDINASKDQATLRQP